MRVMRHVWCIFVLGLRIQHSGSGQHASREPTIWRHLMDSPGYPSIFLHVIQGQPRVDPLVDYIVFFSYLCCFSVTINIINATQRDWRYVGYLEKFFNLVEEYPTLHDTSLKEHKDSIRIGNIWHRIAEAMNAWNVETFIVR